MSELLALDKVTAGYGESVVLEGISLSMREATAWRCWAATAWARPPCW